MDFLIFLIALGGGFAAWRYVSNSSQRRGKGKANLKGAAVAVLVFFVLIAVLLALIQPESYIKSKAQVAEQARAKALADAAEAAKTPEMRAAEKAAAEEAAFEKPDRKTMAYVMCQSYVKETLKAPSTADFPLVDYQAWKQSKQTYVIKSYVDAQNSFGAKLRNHWSCKVRYSGGEESNIGNWALLDINLTE